MKTILMATTIALSTSTASAALIDFKLAAHGERGANSFTLQADNGMDVTVFASDVDGTLNPSRFAYLDHGAGLGVCSTGLSHSFQCLTSSDDNVTPGERININFTSSVNLTNVNFLNAGHRTRWQEGDHAHFSVDGGSEQQVYLSGSVPFNLTGTEFAFYLHEQQASSSQFYIKNIEFAPVSTVPIPAAIWLFGVGFMGLVGVARRK